MDAQTRQEYIRAAVSFLQNPKLVDSSLKDKLKFLRDKGLSEVEVDEALNLAIVNRHQSQSGKWNFLLILGLCVGGYKLYQAYLESKTKANQPEEQQKNQTQPKQTGDKTSLLRNVPHGPLQKPDDSNQLTLNEILTRLMELKRLVDLQRTNFGSEIQSLKTLLLGHEKFAAPPRIPEWQLKDDKKEVTSKKTEQVKSSGKEKKGNEGKKKDQETLIESSNSDEFTEASSVIGPNLS